MTQKKRLYVVAEKALPEVLLKVVEAKKTFGNRAGFHCSGSH